jgi:hypothetical protein
MNRFVSIVFFLVFILPSFGQVKKLDKLEILYAQGHYKMVYRKSVRLLNMPDYDFSALPSYYKALSLFQLAQQDSWIEKHPESLTIAGALFEKVKNSPNGKRLMEVHIKEIAYLKKDLFSWAEDIKRTNNPSLFQSLQTVLTGLFDGIPDIDSYDGKVKKYEFIADKNPSAGQQKEREKALEFAKKQIGTPYTWAGNSPNGFDCSGFTSYVMKELGKELPRRAADQFERSQKVKPKNVQKGDLVFFNNGSGISHVGLIISEKEKPLVMIHASSSKGVIVTEIEKSEYWLKRISGFGTYLEE